MKKQSKGSAKYRITDSGLMVPINRAAKRAYSAASDQQLKWEWLAADSSANGALKSSLKRLRNMTRDLETDNEYVGRFLFEFTGDVVGAEGFQLESMAAERVETSTEVVYEPDEKAQTIIEEAWADWRKARNCTVTRDMPYCEFKSLQERAWVRDGNNLTRIVEGFDNDWKFAVQVIESDHLDIDLNERANTGRGKLVMGKELNSWGECTHFHLLGTHPGDQYTEGGRTRTRVPARHIIHRYFRTRAEQAVGAPMITNAIKSLRHLEKFTEAEVIAARIHACAAVSVEKTEENDDIDNGYGFDDFDLSPGGKLELDYGKTAKLLQPQHPNGNFGEFRKAILMGSASSMLVNYPMLAQDYGGVSYSSLREGRINQKKLMMCFRSINIEIEEQRIFEAWLMNALRRDLLGLPASKFEKFRRARFHGAGFAMVDPQKEANALEKRLELKIEDPYSAAIEYAGKPLGDILKSHAKAAKEFEALDIPLPSWLGGDVPPALSMPPAAD